MTTQSIEEISDYIQKKLEDSEIKIISIDGWMGSGKTYLSNNLEIESKKVAVDDYYHKQKDQYLDVILYDELKNEITESEGLKIVEGICIQQVFDRIGMKPDLTIYIKRLAAGVFWSEEEYVNKENAEAVFKLDEKNSEFDIITGEKRIISDEEKELTNERQGVFYDVVRYHYEFKPHLNSDIIYERVANDSD